MEFKEYIKIFKKNIGVLLLLVVLGVVLALVITYKLPSGYSQSRLFYIAGPKTTSQTNYDYEGYYVQQKARDFTDTAVAILESADFTSEVGIFSVGLSVRKIAPQVLRLTAVAKDAREAEDAIEKISQSFNLKLVNLTGNDPALQIKPIGKAQPSYFSSPNKKILGVFGASLGFIFGIMVVGLKVYFKV